MKMAGTRIKYVSYVARHHTPNDATKFVFLAISYFCTILLIFVDQKNVWWRILATSLFDKIAQCAWLHQSVHWSVPCEWRYLERYRSRNVDCV